MIVYHYPFTELKDNENYNNYTVNKQFFWLFIFLMGNNMVALPVSPNDSHFGNKKNAKTDLTNTYS